MRRRTYTNLDETIKKTIEKLGRKGGSIHEIAQKSRINWKTTKRILEKFEKLGVAENVITHKRLKIYQIKK